MRRLILLIGVAAMLGSTARSQAVGSISQFRYQTIDFPGSTITQAFGLNERGDVVGDYTDSAGNVHGFLLSNGTFSSIDYPGAILTSARSINDAGEIVGAFSTANDPDAAHGYVLRAGKFTRKDFPHSPDCDILGVDERGDITGSFGRSDGTEAGYFTKGGRYTSFVVPGSAPNSTGPHGINDNLQVVGFYTDAVNADVTHGFLLDGATFITVDYPGATSSALFGINEHGEIAGSCQCNDGANHSFVLSDGLFTIVSYPVSEAITKARGINDRDEVVGYYQTTDGVIHGFIATPKRN
ncbi:MAG TPA: hypothetical protein VMH04_01940 [Candidatus Solibacter sp.]|nr:hypothetical protein [Candidatus Solibacter sp.]